MTRISLNPYAPSFAAPLAERVPQARFKRDPYNPLVT